MKACWGWWKSFMSWHQYRHAISWSAWTLAISYQMKIFRNFDGHFWLFLAGDSIESDSGEIFKYYITIAFRYCTKCTKIVRTLYLFISLLCKEWHRIYNFCNKTLLLKSKRVERSWVLICICMFLDPKACLPKWNFACNFHGCIHVLTVFSHVTNCSFNN